MSERRVTVHSGRGGSAKHNGRSFDKMQAQKEDSARHIDDTRSDQNLYWTVTHGTQSDGKDFVEAELDFYRATFGERLTQLNARAIESGHAERVKTMTQYLHGKQTQPDEELVYIGDKDSHVEPQVLWDVMSDQLAWEQKAFPQVQYLDVALHLDETTPHVHARRVFVAEDDGHGCRAPMQKKALEEMGVERPDMTKKQTKFNNSKMTYTQACREHLKELCRERGLEIVDEPREASRSGRSIEEVRAERARQERVQAEQKAAEEAQRASQLRQESEGLRQQTERLTDEVRQRQKKLKDLESGILSAEQVEQVQGRPKAFAKGTVEVYEEDLEKLKKTAAKVEGIEEREKAVEAREKALRGSEKAVEARESRVQGREERVQERERDLSAEVKQEASRLFESFRQDWKRSPLCDRGSALEWWMENTRNRATGESLSDLFKQKQSDIEEAMKKEWRRHRDEYER